MPCHGKATQTGVGKTFRGFFVFVPIFVVAGLHDLPTVPVVVDRYNRPTVPVVVDRYNRSFTVIMRTDSY